MYCQHCGAVISEDAKLCTLCGEAQNKPSKTVPPDTNPGLVGFSCKINDPAFAKYIKNTNRWSEGYYVGLWGQSQEQIDRILSQVGMTKEWNAIVKDGKITFFGNDDEPWKVYFNLTIENAEIVSAVSPQEVEMVNILSGLENGKVFIEGVMQLYMSDQKEKGPHMVYSYKVYK